MPWYFGVVKVLGGSGLTGVNDHLAARSVYLLLHKESKIPPVNSKRKNVLTTKAGFSFTLSGL